MKVRMQEIRIVFRILEGLPIALFPEEVSDPWGNITSYMRVGQHGGADPDLVDDLRVAEEHEYADLLRELRGIYEEDPHDEKIRLVVREEEGRRSNCCDVEFCADCGGCEGREDDCKPGPCACAYN